MKFRFTTILALAVATTIASEPTLQANADSADPTEKLLSYTKFVCLKQTNGENPAFKVSARVLESVTKGRHGELEIIEHTNRPQHSSRMLSTSIRVDLEPERTLDDGTAVQAASYSFMKKGEDEEMQGLLVQPTLVDAKLSKKFNGWFFESLTKPAKFLTCQGSF